MIWKNKREDPEERSKIGKDELKRLIGLLVINICIICGDTVYRQLIGIPMGTDCAPFLANLLVLLRAQVRN